MENPHLVQQEANQRYEQAYLIRTRRNRATAIPQAPRHALVPRDTDRKVRHCRTWPARPANRTTEHRDAGLDRRRDNEAGLAGHPRPHTPAAGDHHHRQRKRPGGQGGNRRFSAPASRNRQGDPQRDQQRVPSCLQPGACMYRRAGTWW